MVKVYGSLAPDEKAKVGLYSITHVSSLPPVFGIAARAQGGHPPEGNICGIMSTVRINVIPAFIRA